MHRWLYFAVSCTAAIGIACGGDSGDGKVYDARVNFDATPSVDAKTFDAPSPDARTFDAPPQFDARPDAPPPIVFDAGPDAPPPIVFDAGPDAPPPCVSDPGCTGAGNFCSDADTSITCAAVAGSPTCFKITATTACAGALVCSGSVTPGQCGCPAPTGGPAAEGGACAQLNQQTCSADGRAVLTCGTVDSCQVYTIAVPAADTCDNAEGTGDGLTCVSNQCVCPPNPTSIFYANPVVDRSARPGLVRNGNRFPALCSYDTLTLALAAASSPNFAETGIAVAAKDNPSAANVGLPAVFDNEDFPMTVPPGRTLTTTDDPVSGVGGSGNWAPQNFIIVADDGGGDASFIVDGNNRLGRGGSLRGVTLVEGSCAGALCGLPTTALLVQNNGAPASSFNALNNVVVEGGGGAIVNETTTGIRTGAITAVDDGDSTEISIAGDANANAFNGLVASDGFWIGLAGSTDPTLTGFFLVEEFVDGNTVIVRNPDGAAGGNFTGTLTVINARTWTTGLSVVNSNATITGVTVRNFASFAGDSHRTGVSLESDHTGNPAAGVEADVIAVLGGRYYNNDVAIDVNSDDNMTVAIAPAGSTPTRIDASLDIGIVMRVGTVTVTGALQNGTSFNEGTGFMVSGTADVSLSGVRAENNSNYGVQYLAGGAGSLIDSGSTFTNNRGDGVIVGSEAEAAKPQAITEANVELGGSTLSDNDRHGLNVTANDHTVWLRGATVSGNGQDGINQSGNSLLVTNGQAADTLTTLTLNGDQGLEAQDGEVRLFNTAVTENGQTDHCAAPAEVRSEMAVVIGGNATLHGTAIVVEHNNGGGVEIDTDHNNTLVASTIQDNRALNNCGSDATDPTLGAGVHVTSSGNLSLDTTGSNITGNARVGLYTSGTVAAPAALTVLANAWTGIVVAAGGSMTQTAGTVNFNGTNPGGTTFNDGVAVEGTYASTGTEYLLNKGDGVFVDLDTTTDRATLTLPSIHNNDGNGVAVLSAPGGDSAHVDDLGPVLDADYGFVIQNAGTAQKASVFSNGGAGLALGAATQPQDIVAKIGDVNIFGNTGVGISVRQSSLQGGEEACGEAGCTGVTILANRIFGNGGGGLNFTTAFIKRLAGTGELRGFANNDIFHNALASCAGPQAAAQIVVTGPTGLLPGVCDDQADLGNCFAQNDPTSASNDNPGTNNQCIWTGSACVVAWDLSSSPTTCDAANNIHDYVTGSENNVGGLFATQGARVLADQNNWRVNPPANNLDYTFSAGTQTVVRASSSCTNPDPVCTELP